MNYTDPRSTRTDMRVHSSKMRGGKLQPVGLVAFRPSESGMISQEIHVELEKIAGRLRSDIVAEVVAVYVPALGVDALYNSDPVAAGNAEIFRQRLEDGEDVFPMENESVITKVMGLEPAPFAGELKINSIARLSHNVAVNFMRIRKYNEAVQLEASNAEITPALLANTALDRFNAVLTPEDRVNGAVQLRGQIPITGIGLRNALISTNPVSIQTRQSDGQFVDAIGWRIAEETASTTDQHAELVVEQDPDKAGYPNINADFALGTGQQLSLTDFLQAERQDELVRLFRAMVDANPEQGQKMITRLVHGLQVETGKIPFTVFQRSVTLNANLRSGMDGPNLDVEQTDTSARISFSAIVPKNEFGGCVVTFLSIKPEEVVTHQPDPVLSKTWRVDNHAADELAIDPVKVLAREMDNTVDLADEETVVFYVGNNHMQRRYERRDWSRDVDPSTIDHKSAVWRYNVPISVSPENIIYPDDIDHYPFALNASTDPVASYTFKGMAQIQSPTIYGPSPIEEIDVVEDEDIFEDND